MLRDENEHDTGAVHHGLPKCDALPRLAIATHRVELGRRGCAERACIYEHIRTASLWRDRPTHLSFCQRAKPIAGGMAEVPPGLNRKVSAHSDPKRPLGVARCGLMSVHLSR